MSKEKNKISLKDKILKNTFFSKLFANYFGFESGIDITNDTQVLYRKNYVIKNIVFVSNMIYSLIFAVLSFGEPKNWVFTVISFPITFLLNMTLKKMIRQNPDNHMRQTIAMYIMSFYMFLSTIIMYFKLKNGEVVFLQECGYILIYYSLTICAFYQDKKMLKNIFAWVIVLVTIIHFTLTYNIVNEETATDLMGFISTFFKSEEFGDILIRTLLLLMFMLVTYISVSMANYMQDQRKIELMKRREVQEDFTKVVTEIFDVTLNKTSISESDRHEALVLASMSKKLAQLLACTPDVSDAIYNFALVYIDQNIDFDTSNIKSEDEKFNALREQTELGSKLISRIQLERKCEDIIRSTFEGSNDEEFISRMNKIQSNIESQIILICDLYVTMRSFKSYKKAYNHKITMNYMEDHFRYYFDPTVFERFMRFSSDFEALYNEN